MYKLTRVEFMQYIIAERRLNELKQKHKAELEQAYDNIHPTKTGVNYDIGVMYAESIDPADYAVFLVELQEKHEQRESYWLERVKALKKAVNQLTEEEKSKINSTKVRQKTMSLLSEIIAENPRLRRNYRDVHQDIREFDKQIESMTKEELLEDYEDFSEVEQLKEKCIYLRYVHEMPYTKISEKLSVTRPRVVRIIKQYEAQLNESELRKWRNSNITPWEVRTKVE